MSLFSIRVQRIDPKLQCESPGKADALGTETGEVGAAENWHLFGVTESSEREVAATPSMSLLGKAVTVSCQVPAVRFRARAFQILSSFFSYFRLSQFLFPSCCITITQEAHFIFILQSFCAGEL